MKKQLAIFGPYPPPLGGMSVHTQRLEYFLIEAGIPYVIFNHGFSKNLNVIPTNKNPLFYIKILFTKKFSLFHFHQIFFFEFLFYLLFSSVNRTPFLITLHNETLLNCGSFKRNIALFLIKNTKRMRVVSVSENLNEFLLERKINTIFLPAYVPPKKISFIALKKDSRIHFVFSMWKFNKNTANGSYNVPLAFSFLKRNKDNFKMIFMIGDEKGSDVQYLNELLTKYEIKGSVLVLYGKNLVDYVQNGSFLLRTNSADGYGISLQEAMDLGVPAIATDVCSRPKGTILFRDNDIEDLTNKIDYIIHANKEELLKSKEKLTYHLKLIEIYKSNL